MAPCAGGQGAPVVNIEVDDQRGAGREIGKSCVVGRRIHYILCKIADARIVAQHQHALPFALLQCAQQIIGLSMIKRIQKPRLHLEPKALTGLPRALRS